MQAFINNGTFEFCEFHLCRAFTVSNLELPIFKLTNDIAAELGVFHGTSTDTFMGFLLDMFHGTNTFMDIAYNLFHGTDTFIGYSWVFISVWSFM